ncbi:MAG: hypothetical protein C4576_32550 [Desulfobacteraceae bacterium]|jgi:hypothetical protein|nr:MAG: hypothetical protein C4576_32550 [Desulfobacteraceae bacterium]
MSTEIFRHYEFDHEGVLKESRLFLERGGYHIMKGSLVGFVFPHIHAKRDLEGHNHEFFGIVVGKMEDDELLSAFIRLQAIKGLKGKLFDYALITPPVNEYLLIEFLENNRGQNYMAIKALDIMWWMVNPEEKSVWCIVGSPRDQALTNHFILNKASLDQVIGMKVIRQNILDEEVF